VGQSGHGKSRGLHFFNGKRKENRQLGTGFFVRHRRVSAYQRLESVSDRMLDIVLKGH